MSDSTCEPSLATRAASICLELLQGFGSQRDTINLESRITALAGVEYAECDPDDLFEAFRTWFNLTATDEEFNELFQLANIDSLDWTRVDGAPCRVTLGEVSIWIAERMSAPSFSPRFIAGEWSAPAGAFCGLRDVSEAVPYLRKRFAPSTPILSCYRGCLLEVYWRRVELMSCCDLPSLEWPLIKVARGLAWKGTLGALLYIICLLITHDINFAWKIPALALVGIIGLQLARAGNPLPHSIRTFGDLARWLAQQQESHLAAERPAAVNIGYDLSLTN